VTGANRGIGFEVCRQLAQTGLAVALGTRDPEAGAAAVEQLGAEGLDVTLLVLDVTDPDTIQAARHAIERERGRLDVLVNNAAGGFDFAERASSADLDVVQATFDTNVFGPWRMIQEMLPLLLASPSGRIVNVSSGGGSFGAERGLELPGIAGYGVSKTALNALTVKLANELRDTGVLVNAVCPGPTASRPDDTFGRPVADGAAGIVWAALLPDDGPTGGFFRDCEPYPW
jgi:NAD(P)-dependent dehydrogenase (short-subunit alcohol dehydrogenase family)